MMSRLQTIQQRLLAPLLGCALTLAGCGDRSEPTIPPVPAVDLSRFMGDWYVIAHIPTRLERNSYAAVESYALRVDGRVQTTFRYRNKSFTAPIKTLRPVGTVRPGFHNAVWDMQFIWPFKAEYVVVYLNEDYSQTIIGRSERDYVWLMARTPRLSESDYARAMERIRTLGYDVARVRRVPQ
ncbi:MAG TPA: lipocalin family protein [Steroidobacteraceae bacterium]